MSFILSSNMNLPIPTVGQEAGPQYAFDVNTSLSLIDSHDHSPGRGTQVTPAGLNINTDLAFHGNAAFDLLALTLVPQSSAATSIDTISVAPGGGTGLADLWYTDGTGTPIQITQNGIVKVTASSITGVSYAAGTFYFTQTVDNLPTTPANLAAGFITVSPNSIPDSPPTIGVTIQPNAAQVGLTDFVLPLLPSPLNSPSFLTIDNSGNVSATTPVTPLVPDNAGAQGYFLRQNGTSGSTWQTLDSTLVSVTTTYAIRTIDDVVQVSGGVFTATLPTAVGIKGKEYTINKTDASLSNIITLKGNGSETIGSFGNTVTLNTQNESWIIYSDNVNWQVKSHTTSSPEMFDTPIYSTGAPGAAISFTSLFSAGVSTITVSSATGLVIGMYLVDVTTSANMAPDTYITSISGTSVGLSHATTGNSAGGSGDTIHTIVSQWKGYREGRFLVANFRLNQTNAGTQGSGDYLVTVPFGLSIDTSQSIYQGTNANVALASATMSSTISFEINTGSHSMNGIFVARDQTHLRVAGSTWNNTGSQTEPGDVEFWGTTGNFFGVTQGFGTAALQGSGWLRVPIQGWYP